MEGVPRAASRVVKGQNMPTSERIVLCVGACFPSGVDADASAAALRREGLHVMSARSQDVAGTLLSYVAPAVVVIDLGLAEGSPLAVADFCNYRRPDARVILVGCGSLMADGAIFGHVSNAAALVPRSISARDMIALIAFHAGRGHSRPATATADARPRTAHDLGGRKLPIGRHADEALAS